MNQRTVMSIALVNKIVKFVGDCDFRRNQNGTYTFTYGWHQSYRTFNGPTIEDVLLQGHEQLIKDYGDKYDQG